MATLLDRGLKRPDRWCSTKLTKNISTVITRLALKREREEAKKEGGGGKATKKKMKGIVYFLYL
jgi:hypothetical protein